MIAGCDDHDLAGWNRFILVSAAVISLGGEFNQENCPTMYIFSIYIFNIWNGRRANLEIE